MSNDVVPSTAKLPTTIMADMAKDSLVGRETMGVKDLALPFISILQALSPQVNKANGKYVKDAEQGDLFNTITFELFDGKEGIQVVPCAFQHTNVEWMPRDSGGGFVAQHADDAIMAKTTRNDRGFDVLSNGNLVVPTAYYYCMMVDAAEKGWSPIVLSMSRTQLKKSRRWNSLMNSIQLKDSQDVPFNPPMFSHKYKLTTVPEAKKDYSWFGFQVENAGMLTNGDLYHAARKLAVDVSKGLVKAQPPVEEVVDPEDGAPAPASGKKKADIEDDIPF